jgi:hypothetical protein
MARNPGESTRKGNRDVDPDDMRRRYDAGEQGAGSTSIGDELDANYDAGFKEGAGAQRKAAPRRALTLQRPSAPPSIAAPFAIELVLISVDEIRNHHRPPIPSRLLAAFAVFGLLGAASGDAAPAANALGWGLVVATLLSSGVRGKQPAGIAALSSLGAFMGGQYATKGSNPA